MDHVISHFIGQQMRTKFSFTGIKLKNKISLEHMSTSLVSNLSYLIGFDFGEVG